MPVSPARAGASVEREQEALFEISEDHGIEPKDEAYIEVMDASCEVL